MADTKNKDIYKTLSNISVKEHIEKVPSYKDGGKIELSYLSWTWAWDEIKKQYPEVTYEVKRFGENNLPYVYDENTGYMVFTSVTINGMTHDMWLPVMNASNKAMKAKPYVYTTKSGKEMRVEAATMFDVNKTIMRCLVKNLAMFGLGLYIYAGEDLPETDRESESKENKKPSQEVKPGRTQKKPIEPPSKALTMRKNTINHLIKELAAKNNTTNKKIVEQLSIYVKKNLADIDIKDADWIISRLNRLLGESQKD